MALDRSTTWPYRDGEAGEFYYSRYSHPAAAEAERALGELEGGEALLFSSGSAAETAAVLGLLEPGQTIALAEGCYYGTGLLFHEIQRWDVRFTEFDQTGPPPDRAGRHARHGLARVPRAEDARCPRAPPVGDGAGACAPPRGAPRDRARALPGPR